MDAIVKFFTDTEFIEDGSTIDLVSIGIVAEDGREYYAENAEADLFKADDWFRVNVTPHLTGANYRTRKEIRDDLLSFCGKSPVFIAHYADYDWVALCQLFGRMIDLPQGWPKFCLDTRQFEWHLNMLGCTIKRPVQSGEEHNALADAKFVRDFWKCLELEQQAFWNRVADTGF